MGLADNQQGLGCGKCLHELSLHRVQEGAKEYSLCSLQEGQGGEEEEEQVDEDNAGHYIVTNDRS